MHIILNLFLIQFIIVNIIDVSGFIGEMETMLARWLKVKSVHIPKPFSCSLCMTFWTGLIYLIISSHLSLLTAAVLLLIANLTSVTMEAVYLFRDILLKTLQFISRIII